jgi:hypothetical protein
VVTALGEMWDDNGVQAPGCLCAMRIKPVRGVGRTQVGGVILDDFCKTAGWERWRGTFIFIPDRIDVAISKNALGYRMDQMMTGPMKYDMQGSDEDQKPFWRQKWLRK